MSNISLECREKRVHVNYAIDCEGTKKDGEGKEKKKVKIIFAIAIWSSGDILL